MDLHKVTCFMLPKSPWAGRLGMFSLINSMEHVSFPGYERHFRSPGQYGYSGIRWSTFNREYLSFEELKSYRHHDLGDVLFQELAKGNLLAYQDEELEKLTKPEKEENYLIIQLDEPIKKVGTCNAIILPEAKVESKDINALNIRQEWYYDAEKGELSSKVISIALMVKEYNYEERQFAFPPNSFGLPFQKPPITNNPVYRLSFFLFLLMFLAHSGANAQSESKDLVWEGEFRYSMVFDRQMKMELLGVEDRPYDSDGFQFWDAKTGQHHSNGSFGAHSCQEWDSGFNQMPPPTNSRYQPDHFSTWPKGISGGYHNFQQPKTRPGEFGLPLLH